VGGGDAEGDVADFVIGVWVLGLVWFGVLICVCLCLGLVLVFGFGLFVYGEGVVSFCLWCLILLLVFGMRGDSIFLMQLLDGRQALYIWWRWGISLGSLAH